jgi:hypothetical protein
MAHRPTLRAVPSGGDYAPILAEACARHRVSLETVDPTIPASRIMADYPVVVWDSIGTGFFESIAIGRPTFLLPSARHVPALDRGLTLGDRFFIDRHEACHGKSDLDQLFEVAMHESRQFLDSFGRLSAKSFDDWIAELDESSRASRRWRRG